MHFNKKKDNFTTFTASHIKPNHKMKAKSKVVAVFFLLLLMLKSITAQDDKIRGGDGGLYIVLNYMF